MKKLITFAILMFSLQAVAQEKYFYVGWDINKPLSNTSWIEGTSTSGIKIGYRFFINDRISAGIDLSSQTFDQYNPTETVVSETGAVTTDFFKYIYSYSGVVSGQYYFPLAGKENIYPYVGLGLGANNNEYTVYYNIYSDVEQSWGFLARPEAGVLVRLGARKSFGLIGAVHLDYSTNQSDRFEYRNFSTVGFTLGLVFLEW